MTGDGWINLYTAKILGFADLETYGFEAIRSEVRQSQSDLWGSGGTLGSSKVAITAAGALLTGTADANGWNGAGYRMALDVSEVFTSVPFANSGATVYSVGLKAAPDVPAAVELGADGSVNYSRYEEHIGEVVTPSSVIDNGDGTVTLVVGATGGLAAWGTNTTARPAKAWLVSPATTGSDAIYDGTAAYDSGDARIEVNPGHQFGQSGTPSTTAADYRVLVEGPSITVESTTDLSADTDYWYLGTVASGTHDDTNQNLLDSFGDTVAAFTAQHDGSTGDHGAVTADSYALNAAAGDDPIAIYTADDFVAYAFTQENITASPTMTQASYDEGTDFVQMYLDAAVTGEARFYIPLRLPGNVTITDWKIVALRNGGGATVELSIVRHVVGTSTAARTVLGTFTFSDTSGSWVTSSKTSVTPIPLQQTESDRLELRLHLKNNGAGNGTARFGQIVLYGEHTAIAGAGWASPT